MLYAVFRIGEASQNMRWTSAQKISRHPAVAWTIPLSLGDSHHGFPVLGTSLDYFTHFRYGDRQLLRLQAGKPFEGVFDAVLGAEVARRLGYRLGQKIVLTHGSGALEGAAHGDKPFFVVGILAPTGTPVDRTVHISLAGMEAVHLDWQGGAPVPGFSIPPELVRKFDLAAKSITVQLVGLKQRGDVFAMQRAIADDVDEPLMGVMPGVALDQLWEVVGQGEQALLLVSWLVALVGLGGLVAVILASLDARRRELAILRSVGARPRELLVLLALEGVAVTVGGILSGVAQRRSHPHRRFCHSPRTRQGRSARVSARALLRRLHSRSAAAGQPDHLRGLRQAAQGRADHGRDMGQRSSERRRRRQLVGALSRSHASQCDCIVFLAS